MLFKTVLNGVLYHTFYYFFLHLPLNLFLDVFSFSALISLLLLLFLHLCISLHTEITQHLSCIFSLSHPFVEGAGPLFLLADEDHTATTGFLLLLGFPQFHLEEQKESAEHDDVTLES